MSGLQAANLVRIQYNKRRGYIIICQGDRSAAFSFATVQNSNIIFQCCKQIKIFHYTPAVLAYAETRNQLMGPDSVSLRPVNISFF